MTLPRLRLQKEVLSKRESRSKSYALLPPTPPHPQRFSLMSRGLVCPTYAKPAPPSPGEGASGTPPCPFLQGSSRTRRRRLSCGVVRTPLTNITPATAVTPRNLLNPRLPRPPAQARRCQHHCGSRRPVQSSEPPAPPVRRPGRNNGPPVSPGLRPPRALV